MFCVRDGKCQIVLNRGDDGQRLDAGVVVGDERRENEQDFLLLFRGMFIFTFS
jgi:hypothetical protein